MVLSPITMDRRRDGARDASREMEPGPQSFLPWRRLQSERLFLRLGTALFVLLALSSLNICQFQGHSVKRRVLHHQYATWGDEQSVSLPKRVLHLRSPATAEHMVQVDENKTRRLQKPEDQSELDSISSQTQRKSLQEFEKEWEDLANQFYRPSNDTAGSTTTMTNNQHHTRQQLDIITALGFPTPLLEMEDGRDFWCLDSYHYLWSTQEPFSGLSFFEWLNATDIESEECSRIRLNRRLVVDMRNSTRHRSKNPSLN